MKNVCLNLQLNKGFFFTLDSLMLLIFVTTATLSLNILLNNNENITEVLLFQQAQDIAEVCAIEQDSSHACFDFLEKINPAIEISFNGDNGIIVKRDIGTEHIQLSINIKD